MDTDQLIKQVTKKVIEMMCNYELYKIPVGVSNRHIHVTQEVLEELFGKGYKLTKKVDLKQPGQFASNETVTIRGPKGEFEKVRILGPVRKESQIEISKTDSFRLGIKSPIRESGDLKNSPGIDLVGPNGIVKLDVGAIVALRHIHMTTNDAKKIGVRDKEIVEVETFGQRKGIFGDVLIRVSDSYSLEMHVDVDEANACNLSNGDFVIVKK
ncbi:MAG: phosphate propanoyltransferase [Lachnospirales bacterium]